ncbi:UDP-glucuronosyltransferase 3A1-like [Scaptodrosophila lebanonensis]|uniref:UDP-glucuronosyltransferase 3A1-like n=1 Tax=Drosophila lebanonensis TaxID=7225 RepID=A0A6J2TT90_DROLE|nr:UDP-glucuronosyltransferase 3A1-like [Scaptodrosophila lebanonensis]
MSDGASESLSVPLEMLRRTLLYACLATQLLGCTLGANILALMGMTSPSNHIWNSVLLHELATRGHNLTILSVDVPRPNEQVPDNVTYIHLERAYDMYKQRGEGGSNESITSFIGLGGFESIRPFYKFGLETARHIAKSNGMQQLLNYPDDFHFDLIVNDYTMGPYLLGFVHKFRYPPILGMSAFHNPPITMDFMSNTYLPALTPFHSTSYSPQMNFFQRLHNTLIFAADTIYRRWHYNPALDEIMRPHFGDDMPPLDKLAKRTLISLVNSHPAIDYAEALPPSIIEVGGMQIRKANPLSPELETFVREGRQGAVLFSLGTNMQPRDVDKQTVRIIVEAFRQLPEYNFLWKFDAEYLREIRMPKNVLVSNFLPQRDILAHDALRAFVSHCGGLSSQEATWHGVPLVGIPLFLDQHRNLRQSLNADVAVQVDYLSMTTQDLIYAIKEATENEQIAAAMQARSARFRDNPITPLKLAVWWVEYLLRQPEPHHLQSPAKDMNYFEAHSLDVLALLLFIIWRIYEKFR